MCSADVDRSRLLPLIVGFKVVPPQGLELSAELAGKRDVTIDCSSACGSTFDIPTDLRHVIDSWASLTDETRNRILSLVDEA